MYNGLPIAIFIVMGVAMANELKKLTPELKAAFGNDLVLIQDYDKLLNKDTVKDDEDSKAYIADLVRKYTIVKSIVDQPVSKFGIHATTNPLALIRNHAADVGAHTYTNPAEFTDILSQVGFKADEAADIAYTVQQQLNDGVEVCCNATSETCGLTSQVCAGLK